MAHTMPVNSLDFSVDSVLPFVQSLIPGLHRHDGMRAIGLCRGDDLVAGVVYEGFNGRNMWMHVAAMPGARWLVRDYLKVCFKYPFNVCGVDRVSGYVDARNEKACKFDEHLGFHEEARLRGAAPDGGDVILYVMWRDQCRYLGD